MKWDEKALNIFGLNQTEQQILESLTVSKSVHMIAKETDLSRTGINYSLGILIGKGLVITTRQGKRKFYLAIDREELVQKLQMITDSLKLESEVKKGARVKTSVKDEFIIHNGLSEIIPTFIRVALLNKDQRIKAIQHHRSHNNILDKLTPGQVKEFNQAIIQNRIIVDAVLNEGAYKSYFLEIKANPERYKEANIGLEGRMADYSVFPDDRFDYDSEIWLFKTTTLIINWKEEVAVEIINAAMTGFMGEMFEYVKDGTRKIDHNKMMRELMEKVR